MNRAIPECVRGGWILLMVLCSTAAYAESERESLKFPVLRIPATADPGVSTRGSAAPTIQAVQAVEEETKVASLAPKPTVELELSEPARILQSAVADARVCLQHIQANIKDYTCVLIKRENVNGTVVPTEYIETKIRNRKVVDGQIVVPLSVYMRFLKPPEIRGREVLYIEGQNNNYVRVKEGGTRGRFLPSVWLPANGRLAMQTNRYPIWEVGIENLVTRLIERSCADNSIDTCQVVYQNGAKIDGRPCKFLQVKRPHPSPDKAHPKVPQVYLAQVFIDTELNVPIRYAAYDWPKGPGERPEVVEEYTYQNLKLNVGLTDRDFDVKNPDYNF